MKRLSNHIALLMAICFMLFSMSLMAQTKTDSLFARANELIYEDPDQAITLGQQIYELPELTVKNKVNALLLISTAYSSKRDYVGAQDYILKIENLLPEINEKKLKMNILNRIGAQYQDLQIYDKAIEYLNMSLSLIESYPQKDSIQTLLGYNSTIRGFIYREQMNCDIALKYFNKAIDAYSKTPDNHIRNANSSVCYYNKGNCLLSMDRTEDAKASFQNSIEHARAVEASSLIAFGQKGLAEVMTLESKYMESIAILNEALNISQAVGDLILNKGIYDGLANNYLALNDWENYNINHQKFINLQNITKSSERQTINQSLLNLTKTKEKEFKDIQNFYKPIQIILIIILIMGILLFFRFILQSEKNLKTLQKKLKD